MGEPHASGRVGLSLRIWHHLSVVRYLDKVQNVSYVNVRANNANNIISFIIQLKSSVTYSVISLEYKITRSHP
jgi:hypothetical protein